MHMIIAPISLDPILSLDTHSLSHPIADVGRIAVVRIRKDLSRINFWSARLDFGT